MTFRILTFAFLALTACSPLPRSEVPERRAPADLVLPPMKVFSNQRGLPTRQSNSALSRDFLELSFQMESGRPVPVMTRFQGPITLRVTGDAPANLAPDLRRLISRLRTEAGLDISQVPRNRDSNITIQAIPQRQLQGLVPQAACFVVPRVSNWAEFRANRRGNVTDWTTLTNRDKVAIFVPSNVSPQELRDCLHEEIAQALGPLNDMYRLPNSVFNDDNFHTVLTGFDMLMLRIYYAPELQNGMSRDQVAQKLPAILSRLNPAGRAGNFTPQSPTPRAWINALETALGPVAGSTRRRSSARQAIDIARAQGWTDNRLAFSLFAYGRLVARTNPDAALLAFLEAGTIYRANPETQLQAAHVEMHLAVYLLSSGRPDAALTLADKNLPVVSQAQNAALLSTLLMIKAEALEQLGRTQDAASVRLDSLGWARYGFGSEAEVRARLENIMSLVPRRQTSGG